jgi:hypothetical protein
MSWKSWTAGTLGTAAIIGALAFANIAAAGSGAAEVPAAPTQVQVGQPGVAGGDPVAPTSSPSPSSDLGPLPYCGSYAMPVPGGLAPGEPIPTPPGFDSDDQCFATQQEVQEHFDPPQQ